MHSTHGPGTRIPLAPGTGESYGGNCDRALASAASTTLVSDISMLCCLMAWHKIASEHVYVLGLSELCLDYVMYLRGCHKSSVFSQCSELCIEYVMYTRGCHTSSVLSYLLTEAYLGIAGRSRRAPTWHPHAFTPLLSCRLAPLHPPLPHHLRLARLYALPSGPHFATPCSSSPHVERVELAQTPRTAKPNPGATTRRCREGGALQHIQLSQKKGESPAICLAGCSYEKKINFFFFILHRFCLPHTFLLGLSQSNTHHFPHHFSNRCLFSLEWPWT